MAIAVGDRLPDVTFYVMTSDGAAPRRTADVFAGRNVALVGVPGAFSPTCHRNHLPGYIENVAILRARGLDAVAVTAINDVFVMDAWARATGGAGLIEFLADGSGEFARAIGMDIDASARGFGLRSRRYSMVVRDGVVGTLAVEEQPGTTDLSGATALLATLADHSAGE